MVVFFFIAILYVIYGIHFLSSIFRSIARGGRKTLGAFPELMMIITEVVFTIVGPAIGFMRFDEYPPEIPFAKQHILTVMVFVGVASLSFWIARFTTKTASPVLRILVSAGLLQGIIFCAITSIHFLTFIPLGIIYPMMGFELLSPVFAYFLLVREFHFFNKLEFDYDDALPYREELGFIPLPVRILKAPIIMRILIYAGILMVMVVLQMLVAYGCGQEIDGIVKAFTHSTGFVFSR